MDSAAIDLSGGIVPKTAPAPSAGIDLSGGLVPASAPAAAPATGAAAATAPTSATPPQQAQAPLNANSNGEGLYQLQGPDGAVQGIPYSRVPQALHSGYQFHGDGKFSIPLMRHVSDEEARYNRDYEYAVAHSAGAQQLARQDLGPYMGAARSAAQTAIGVRRILPAAVVPQPSTPEAAQQLRNVEQFAGEGNQTGEETLGAIGETGAEYLSGEELLGLMGKAVKGADALKGATQLSSLIQKSPTLAKYLRIGIEAAKQASIAGGQTYLKTGDTGAAGTSAATAGLLTAVPSAVMEGVGSWIGRNATTMDKVAGVDVPVSAEARTTKPTPLQASSQQAIRNSAQDTLANRLEEVNESRAVPDSAPALPQRTGPYEFTLKIPAEDTTTGQAAHSAGQVPRHAFEQPAYTTSSAPTRTAEFAPNGRVIAGPEGATGADISTAATPEAKADKVLRGELRTQDPNVARAHIQNLNQFIEHDDFAQLPPAQQNELLEARTAAQQQMGEYHEQVRQNLPGYGKPNFPQVNIPETIKNVGSYTEAADHLEKVATDGYNSISDSLGLNDISGGKFSAIREANKEAWQAYKGAHSVEAMQAAERAVDETNAQMEKLLRDDIGGAVSQKELDGFNDAYRQAQKLRYVANAVDSSFTGNVASKARRAYEYVGFDGGKMMGNLRRLETKFGRKGLERVVGGDNLDNLYRIAELNRNGAQRSKFGAATAPVADWLQKYGGAAKHLVPMAMGAEIGRALGVSGYTGAALGELGALGVRRVANAMLTNPKIAQNLIFAMESGARPERYAPLIGTMIVQQETKAARQQQQQQEQLNSEDKGQ